MDLVINEKVKDSNIRIIDNTEKKKMVDNDGFEYDADDEVEKGILTIEAQMRKEKFLDEKNPVKPKNFLAEMTRRVIMISLYDMNLDVLTNTKHLSGRQREELQLRMRQYEDVSIEDIKEKFNKVCNYEIFDNPKLDYSKLPVYNC